jgi:hypothetical protein
VETTDNICKLENFYFTSTRTSSNIESKLYSCENTVKVLIQLKNHKTTQKKEEKGRIHDKSAVYYAAAL